MTKKHFIALAQELKSVRPVTWMQKPVVGRAEHSAWYEACNAVATACKRHNPAFDWQRFMDACGALDPNPT
jgi:hypothetical protein